MRHFLIAIGQIAVSSFDPIWSRVATPRARRKYSPLFHRSRANGRADAQRDRYGPALRDLSSRHIHNRRTCWTS